MRTKFLGTANAGEAPGSRSHWPLVGKIGLLRVYSTPSATVPVIAKSILEPTAVGADA